MKTVEQLLFAAVNVISSAVTQVKFRIVQRIRALDLDSFKIDFVLSTVERIRLWNCQNKLTFDISDQKYIRFCFTMQIKQKLETKDEIDDFQFKKWHLGQYFISVWRRGKNKKKNTKLLFQKYLMKLLLLIKWRCNIRSENCNNNFHKANLEWIKPALRSVSS